MEPTDLSVKSSKKPRNSNSSPRDVTNIESARSSRDRRSAFVPVAPSASTNQITSQANPPISSAMPYPSFLTGLPHPSSAAVPPSAGYTHAGTLAGTISVYSDLLQQQLTRADNNSCSGHSSLLNNSLGQTSTEDEMESPSTRKQTKTNRKQTKARISKV